MAVEIKGGKKILITPIFAEDLKDIHIGDIVFLTGDITTCRDVAHRRVVEEGREIPVDVKDAAIFHAGPIIRPLKDEQYEMVSVGPTTSMRMEKFEYEFVETTGVRVIVGKGGMDDNTQKALVENNCVFLTAVGGCAALYVNSIKKVDSVNWLDLGMPEAIWELDVECFGPLIVTMDSKDNNLYKRNKE